jgi:hypothetical protein
MWLSAGAGAMWSDACRKALIACGINPDNFGTYKDRADAQSAERAKYQEAQIDKLGGPAKKHPAPCKYAGASSKPSDCSCYQTPEALKEVGGDRWITLNSQSGHLSRNAFYQGEGARADPCSNIRPGPGNSGSYGYRDDAAFCMDHAGLRTGMEHYEICRREQRQNEHVGDGAMPVSPRNPPDGTSLREGVEGTARIVVEGTASRRGGDERYETFDPKDRLGKQSEKREERGDTVDAAREKAAKELQDKDAQKAGKVDSKDKAKPKTPNSPAGGDEPSQKTKDQAVKCIADAWEASLKEMQTSAITEYGTAAQVKQAHVDAYNGKKPAPKPPAKTADDLPKKEKAAADEAAKKAVDEKQKELEKKGAESAGRAGDPPPKEPTKEQCLEYQANWLEQHRDSAGSCPPMQGSGGGGPPPQTTPEGQKGSARKKK